MTRLGRPSIFLVTSGTAIREDDEGWIDALRSAARGADAGVDAIQIREPQLTNRALAVLVRDVLEETDARRTLVIVNDRPDVAVACGAAGVHLRGDGMPASRVRELLAGDHVVGRSVHSVAEARDAAAVGGIDYLFFGTVFPSASKPAGHRPQGTRALKAVCESVRIPVIAIGGITPANAVEAAAAGAAGIAAIALFAQASRANPAHLAAAVRDLRAAFR